MIVCINCALRAFLNDEPIPDYAIDTSVIDHLKLYHPDFEQARRDRKLLETAAREKVARRLREARLAAQRHRDNEDEIAEGRRG